MIIDSHCHLQFKAFRSDLDKVLERCREKEIIMNVVGTQKDTSAAAVDLARKHNNLFASVGLHPIQEHQVSVSEENWRFLSRSELFDYEYYSNLAKSDKVVGIGETGLDKFHIPVELPAEQVLERQMAVFMGHVRLAQSSGLPLVIHVRDAHEEMLSLLSDLRQKIKGVIHCYSGTSRQAKKYLDLGFYLGFNGMITFPANKKRVREHQELEALLKNMPVDRILVETDAPFLAPQKYRGRRSEPWMVEEVVKKIAQLREIDQEELKPRLKRNTLNLFTKMAEKLS